jgi:hypothetical protein
VVRILYHLPSSQFCLPTLLPTRCVHSDEFGPANGLKKRVDPNRIYWQRNEDLPRTPEEEDVPSPSDAGPRRQRSGSPRPPSYASDDGVSYVVEAQPRSVAPTTDVPLPVHPSEVGRVALRPLY